MKTEINTVDSNGYNLKYETLNVKKTSYSDIIEECFNLSIEKINYCKS